MQRIIFLDVDGPLIPSPLYFTDICVSQKRMMFSTVAVGFLNSLCKQSGAQIVFNSTHNSAEIFDEFIGKWYDLKSDAIRYGIKPQYIHEQWKTGFPNMVQESYLNPINPRMAAIIQWQKANGEVDWIAFDDEPFVKDQRLIVVDFDRGLDYDSYKMACALFGVADATKGLIL